MPRKRTLLKFDKNKNIKEILPPGYITGLVDIKDKDIFALSIPNEPIAKGIYIANCPEEIILDVIEHETLHNVIARDISYDASKKFDYTDFVRDKSFISLYKIAEGEVNNLARKSKKPRNKRKNH